MKSSFSNISFLAINRTSVVPNAPMSRSFEERVFETLDYLTKHSEIKAHFIQENIALNSINPNLYSHAILNRPHSHDALNLILRLKEKSVKIVIDLDDIPVLYPKHDAAAFDDQKKYYFNECLKNADIVNCSTTRIMDWVSNWGINTSKICFVRTGLNFDKITSVIYNSPKITGPVLTNTGTLKLGGFENKWIKILKEFYSLQNQKINIYADQETLIPKELPYNYLGRCPWFQHKVEVANNFCYSLSPLSLGSTQDDLFSIYKTPIKYIMYGGLGVPGLYSKNPIYTDIIESEVNGILVDNTEEAWKQSLMEIHFNLELRDKIKRNAKQEVRSKYSIELAAKDLLDSINQS